MCDGDRTRLAVWTGDDRLRFGIGARGGACGRVATQADHGGGCALG